MKNNNILIIVAVVVILCCAYFFMTRGGGGVSKPKGVIETQMPQWGYSLDNDGYDDAGMPQDLPETLPAPPVTDTPEPEMMGTAAEPPMSWGMGMETTPGPVVQNKEEFTQYTDTEGFTQYAPRRFKGDIL